MRLDDKDIIGRPFPMWRWKIPYGKTYYDYSARQTVLHPFPLHLLIKYARSAYFTLLNRWSALECIEEQAYRLGIEEGENRTERSRQDAVRQELCREVQRIKDDIVVAIANSRLKNPEKWLTPEGQRLLSALGYPLSDGATTGMRYMTAEPPQPVTPCKNILSGPADPGSLLRNRMDAADLDWVEVEGE